MQDPQRVLVINVTRIGDTLAATPAIQALHKHWPRARITALGKPRNVELLDNLPGIERVATISKRSALIRGWLGAKSYDLALVYNYDEALVRYALRVARRVVAFRQESQAINKRLYRCVDPEACPTVHITEHASRLPAALGIRGDSGRIVYRCRPEEIETAKNLLQSRGFDRYRPLIGLQVASFATKSYRDWPIENFLELSRKTLQHWRQAGFLVFGGAEERERTDWLKRQLGDRACLLAGQLSLRETAALMSQTDLYIGVDTGPTHLMSSFDIPIIGLYHPRHRAVNLGPKDHPLNFSLDHPCGDDRDGEPRPMLEITVASVFDQVKRALAARGLHGTAGRRPRLLWLTQGSSTDLPSQRLRALEIIPLLAEEFAPIHCPAPTTPVRAWRMRRELREADVVVLQKELVSLPVLWVLRHFSRRLIYDFDDCVHLRLLADGSCRTSRKRNRRFAAICRTADLVIAGNSILAAQADRFGSRRTAILPTAVALPVGSYTETGADAPVRLGWIGTNVNLPYLEALEPIFLRLQAEGLAFSLRVMAGRAPQFRNFTAVEFVPWSPEAEEAFLASLDVGLMPLADNEHTRGKCAYKALQYMSLGKPVVSSDVGVNAEWTAGAGFTAADPDEMASGLRKLISDPALRTQMGAVGSARVRNEFARPLVAARLRDLIASIL
jgi:heptosyltransferase-3